MQKAAVFEYPGAVLPGFSLPEQKRYSRQLDIDGFGGQAQARLKAATVAISRCGGVGGTCAMLLARAGIGRLILAHGGHVTLENLNRMHLAGTSDLDRPYTDAFVDALRDINPSVSLIPVPENVSCGNVRELVTQADLVADGAPLFEERWLMNSEAIRQNKPLVSGAMYDLEGYVTTIIPGCTPCLSCIYPAKPDYWTLTAFPVIAPISTLVGAIMAMEVIKLLTGVGDTLQGLLWRWDIRSNLAKQFKVVKRVDCPVCGHQRNGTRSC